MAISRGGIKRVDKNQREIVSHLRTLFCSVLDLSAVGRGCPDLLVCFRDDLMLVEVKCEKGRLTPDQTTWHSDWQSKVHIVRSVLEAEKLLGVVIGSA